MQNGTPQSIESANISGKEDHRPRAGAGWSAEEKSKQRRAHHKSRYGCQTCKKKRVKCDEKKPECSNCMFRQIRCDYIHAASSNSGKPRDDEPSRNQGGASSTPANLNVADLELMYHWTTSTCHTLVTTTVGAMYWKHDVTETSLSHETVLHLLLAIAALHLAYSRPARREEYLSRANDHYSAALPVLTTKLSQLHQEDILAVLLAERMLNFVIWARGPQPRQYLAFSDGGHSEFLTSFRGIRTTAEAAGDETVYSKLQGPGRVQPLPPTDPPFEYKQPLANLRDYVAFASSPSARPLNIESCDVLLSCYHNRYEGVDSEYHVAFAWLYKMKEDFLEAMQRHDAVPLIIYAHFAVLLQDMERFWYMRGWTSHVMGGIWNALGDQDRLHIRWPCSVLGWIPPS